MQETRHLGTRDLVGHSRAEEGVDANCKGAEPSDGCDGGEGVWGIDCRGHYE